MGIKKLMDDLKHQFVHAKSDEKHNAACENSGGLVDDAKATANPALLQDGETNLQTQALLMEQLKEVLPAISVTYIAKTYFNRSRSWLLQRIYGNTVNGVQAKFTDEELKILEKALRDLSSKISALRFS